jgi:hypothetical protein
MKEYLKSNPAAGVSVAIVVDLNEENAEQHYVFLINERSDDLKGCMVVSRGYGENLKSGEKIETSILRHVVDELPANSFVKIEPIMPELFGLNNEYWVSFWIDEVMYDKRYIFLPESIKEENLVAIPIMQKNGVLIR